MRCIALFGLVGLVASAQLQAQAPEPGALWQSQTTMEMSGMKMPGQKSEFCVPLNAEGPEAMSADDNQCTVSNVRRSPGRFSYNISCPEGTGTGEMVYQGRDAYTQKMTMTADGETMSMVTTAKRTGTCDAGKVKRQVAQAEAQGREATAKVCESMATGLLPSRLKDLNCPAQYKKQLCDRFNARPGFDNVAARSGSGDPQIDADNLAGVAGYCGVSADTLRTRLCREAMGKEDLNFVGRNCPTDAQAIAQRECAGRGITSPPAEKYREFCSNFARDMMTGGASGEVPAAKPKPVDAVKEGAKKLKGLFGL